MPQTDIEELLAKYRSGTISHQEWEILESWYLQWNPDKKEVSDGELETISAEVLDNLSRSRNRPTLRFRKHILAAASVFCLLSITAYFLSSVFRDEKPREAVIDFRPGSNKAILRLSNGDKIILSDSGNGVLSKEGDVLITKSADGKVTYKELGKPLDKLIYNTLSTPRGGQYQTVLSDGTRVWLNASSSIEFPVQFIGKERRVTVVGEAYFEVFHDKKPFIVMSGHQEVRVLGTNFNICSYADDLETVTSLISGSVAIKNNSSGQVKKLIPGEAAVIRNGNGDITVGPANLDGGMAWKNGYFLFDDQQIGPILKVLSRWYDVDVQYDEVNVTDRFGGTFSRAGNLSQILRNIEQLGNVRFTLKPGKIIVTSKEHISKL